MKTFDISKNIILAFIILMSIALNLSAHESTISLISSDNISIEKDKNEENISKRNLPSKKILCYERDKKGILDYIFPAILFFLGYILNWLVSIRTDRKRKKTIKKELEGNKNYLTEKYKNIFEELLENDLPKLEKYLSEIGIDSAVYDFNNNYEFNEKFKLGLNINNFCDKFKGYLEKDNRSAEERLNGLLCDTSFYDNIFKKIKPNISLSKEIEALVKKTQNDRDKIFSELNDIQKYFIKRLNRFLIEAAYPNECPNIKVTRLTKDLESDYFIHLSDTSWNQYKYVISDKEYIISKAYMLIGEINALSNASIHTDKDKTLPKLARAIISAKVAINSAIEKL